MVTSGESGGWEGGINWVIRIDNIYTIIKKQITSKNLLYSIGNSSQYSVMASMGTASKKVDICITDSHCHSAETNTTL